MNLSLNDFQYIVTIAEEKSFNAAAKKLYVTQPSLSQRVKHIESMFGIRIFERDTNGTHLTTDGQCFVEYGRKILRNAADLQSELLYRRNAANITLRFGITWVFDTPFFYNLFFRFSRNYPHIHFELTEQSSSSLQQALLSNKIDIALGYLPIENPELSYEIVYNDSIVLLPASDSLLTANIQARKIAPGALVPPSLLNDEPFSTCIPNALLTRYLDMVIEKERISPVIHHTLRGLPFLYALAKNGAASTFLYKSFFLSDDTDSSWYLLNSSVPNTLTLALIWRKGSHYQALARDLVQLF